MKTKRPSSQSSLYIPQKTSQNRNTKASPHKPALKSNPKTNGSKSSNKNAGTKASTQNLEPKLQTQNGFVDIFLVVPIGFERLAQHELEFKFPGLVSSQVEKGGVSISVPEELILALNQSLKIPTSIYLRIAQFKAKDFPKLYQKVSKIKWGSWIQKDLYEISASTHSSRLKLKKRIEETVKDGIERHFQMQPPKKIVSAKKPDPIEILARIIDDECTISINTSGEGLYKRGYKELEGAAPIRENLAAGLFYALHLTMGPFDEILDPMMGSGTLLSESFLFFHPSPRHDFSCLNMPKFMNLNAVQGKAEDTPKKDLSSSPPKNLRLVGFDKNPKSVQLALNNILNGIQSTFDSVSGRADSAIENNSWDRSQIQIKVFDFLDQKNNQAKNLSPELARVAIINPPYGERLQLPLPPKEFYNRLSDWLYQAHVSGFGIIVPQKDLHLVPKKWEGYNLINSFDFENGGIPVQFQIRKRI